MTQLDRLTTAGIVACAASVAAFSAWSQFETARLAGVPAYLSWVFPVATDATGFVATRAWLGAKRATALRRYAASITISCIALAFASAGAHLAVSQAVPAWWFRLLVGGLPSLALAALVHLIALASAEESAPARTARKPRPAPQSAGGAEFRSPTSASSVSTPPLRSADGPPPTVARMSPARGSADATAEPAPTAPEIGAGSVREQMFAYLDANGLTTGAQLDRIFERKNYGARVVREWTRRQSESGPHLVAIGE